MNPKVDKYLAEGCGRCALFATPECKVHKWTEELEYLRKIVLECGLKEELKWSVPVYTFKTSNILLLSAFKENCVVSFIKGALLKDPDNILEKPGENTQAGRVIRFTDTQKISKLENAIRDFINEAVQVEKSGLKVKFKKTSEYELPVELQNKFGKNSDFKNAFEKLTPGRQKGYILHFSQAKQSKTRESRIEKCIPKILIGKGLNDI